MRVSTSLLATTLLLIGAACGDTGAVPTLPSTSVATTVSAPTTLVPAGRAPTIRWSETGGCMVLGPNCPTWVVYSDGWVEVSRTPTGPGVDDGAQATGTVSVDLLEAILRETRATDAATLADDLGPGSCQSCVDGADIVVTILDGEVSTTLDSLDVAFDPDHPLVAALTQLMSAVRAVELPLVSVP